MFTIKLFEEFIELMLITALVGLGIYVIRFIIISGKKSANDAPHALGLPAGSIRATLALTLIVFFVFIAVYFYLQTKDADSKHELGQSILTILGTLVVSISAFYFGTKATELGSKTALDAFQKIRETEMSSANVPAEVISEAIKNNKENWIDQFKCSNIKPGKKSSGNTNFELNCLVFFVASKDATLEETTSIPPFITYISQGKNYEIPTDVRLEGADITLSNLEISKLAVNQNRDDILSKHPNIECISDTLKDGNSLVTIYLKDNNIEMIPKELIVTLKNDTLIKVPTEIISNSGEGTPHIGQASDELSDTKSSNYFGSICCLVNSSTNPNFIGIVTAGHIFTYGDYYNYGGVLGETQRRSGLINGVAKSNLYFQYMWFNQDIAITEITDKSNLLQNYISFANGYYQVSELDFHSETPNITIASRQNNIRDAYILDFNVSFEIKYFNSSKYIRNIILIGSTNDRKTSQPVSKGGDSGGCVYHKETGRLIGLLLGGNNKFSFVLPISETLNSYNFKLL